jgi:hypothetical protein
MLELYPESFTRTEKADGEVEVCIEIPIRMQVRSENET